ncbi:MAG: prolipoprotein diacylglyceryl transferase, partial [Rhodobacteraceae bacterium]|nr:prolipoprotein diacylglyceryl transferase [Paracoccaceae bacterium]
MSFHGGFLGVVIGGALFCWRHGIAMVQAGDLMALCTAPGLLFGRLANFINAELWGRPSDLPWAVVFPGPHAAACPPGWPGECARHPSQLYEAGLEGLVLGLVLAWLAYRRGWLGTPGALTGVFLMGYGAARAFVEFFRQADPQFITAANPEGYRVFLGAGWGLTTGQLLSLPMLAIGLWLVIRARRRA